jgi:hypothetical protein
MLTVGTLAVVPSAAEARSIVVPDAREDLIQPHVEGTPPAPGRVDGDIVRSTFRHKHTRIRVRVGLGQLRRNFSFLAFAVPVRTNEGLNRYVLLTVDSDNGGPWRGSAAMYRYNDDAVVRCRVHRRVDYDANALVIGFPRTCVSKPRWVRLGAALTVYGWPRADGTTASFEDDALLDGRISSRLAHSSRKIHRG